MDTLDLGQTLRGFTAGQKVFERYTLTRMLGRGGMGVVWLARDEKLEQEVALKFLPELVANDPGAVSDLKRETRRSLQLTHPHIVRIYDFVEDGRAAAVSMEFIDGASLTQRRLEQPAQVFDPQELRSWLEQLCGALQYAHSKARIVHRDLKPANLMVDKLGDLKVADFGISATLADTTTRVSNKVGSSGTPVYMSPQQMMGDRPSETDDIYSLGATLYELLTGKPPFYSGNVLLQVQSKVPPSIAERRVELGVESTAQIPVSWETAIAACLDKAPERRPQSAQELAAALLGAPDQIFQPQARPAAPLRPAPARVVTPAVTTAAAPQKAPFYGQKWVLIGGAVVVGLLVLWQGDVINRVKAGSAHKESVRQQVAGDLRGALRSAREVVALRPQDAEYRLAYDEVQRRHLQDLAAQVAALEPEQAYAVMQAENTGTAPYLAERFAGQFREQYAATEQRLKDWVAAGFSQAETAARAGRFAEAYRAVDRVRGGKLIHPGFDGDVSRLQASEVRYAIQSAGGQAGANEYDKALATLASVGAHGDLVPEYATTVSQTRERQVRYEIAQALKLSDGDQFEEAQAQLVATSKRGLLLDEIETARSQIGRQAEQACIATMAEALQARNTAQAQRIIDRFAALSGRKFKTTAAALEAETELTAFLDSLVELRMRPASGEKRTGYQDLVLVESCKSRFRDPAAVERFLAMEYESWSRSLDAAGMPGAALYLAKLAEDHGAKIAAGYRSALLARAGERLSATLLLPAAQAGDATMSRQAGELQRRFAQYLSAPFSSWLKVSQSGAIRVDFQLGRLETAHEKRESSGSSRYQSGTRSVANPAYAQAVAAVQSAEMRYNTASATSMANNNARLQRSSLGTSDLGSAFMDLGSAAQDASALIVATNQLSSARTMLNNTPELIEEAVYDTEQYRIIDHALVHRLDASAAFSIGGKSLGQPLQWAYELKEEVKEIVGNARHGVPVQAAKYLSRDVVLGRLLEPMGPAVEDKNAYAMLEDALVVWSLEQTETRKLEALPSVDLFWCLRELWVASGQTFRRDADALKLLRQELGLPPSTR